MDNNSLTKFSTLYKSNNFNLKQDLQEKRRQLLLQQQKENRIKLQDDSRGIQNFVKKCHKQNFIRKSKTYSEKYNNNFSLQLSEWFKEKPNDMESWYLVPCPKGKRCILISSDGYTEVYTKNGNVIKKMHTMLPGDRFCNKSQVTILDCIFIKKSSTYYVLDILTYGHQDFINCETEFRFFWIKSKFSDDSLLEINNMNDCKFIPLTFYDFQDEFSIINCFSRYPQWDDENIELDGFLFYHKEASYTCGTTPLVGWLFGFMIPEVLHYNVHEKYLGEKPNDYVDFLNYMIQFDENIAKKNNKRNARKHKRNEKMEFDTSSDVDEQNLIDFQSTITTSTDGNCDDYDDQFGENHEDNDLMNTLCAAENLELEDKSIDDIYFGRF